MKYIIALLLAASLSQAKTIKEDGKEYQCNPVKTCEERLIAVRAELKKVKQQLKEEQDKLAFYSRVSEKETVVEVIKEKKIIKKHILSVLAHKTAESMSVEQGNNYANIESSTVYIPSITYQYQFDIGLVPLIGLDLYKNTGLLLGLGLEF